MNNISIVGRLTKDPELSKTNSGITFTRFNVAVPSEFKTADGERQADFFVCIAWQEKAENIAKYFKKGYPIGIMGSMNSRFYEKEDGTRQTIWELNVKGFAFIGGSNEEKPAETKSKSKTKVENQTSMELEPIDDDDLPC